MPAESKVLSFCCPRLSREQVNQHLKKGVCLTLSWGLKFLGHSRQLLAQEVMGKSYLPSTIDISVNALGSNRAEGQGF